ncbi:MAG: VIT1/CCC1 transporter family protein [Acidobacteria bacterium]|nr:VIT1/CCC1 transporter family protein [Acidobacteriota bacterium]
MPQTPHAEKHFTSGAVVRDIVIGMSDGLTVPFALAAGLTGAIASSGIVVTAGLAEIAAGAIAMGLGGYLAARSDAEHYDNERKREVREIHEKPEAEMYEVVESLERYGLSPEECRPIVDSLRAHPDAWADFMMRFELGLEKPDPGRALASAVTIGGAYIAGGLVPLAPYFFTETSTAALGASVAMTATALLVFGYVKGTFTGARPVRSSLQTLLIGSLAAAAAFAQKTMTNAIDAALSGLQDRFNSLDRTASRIAKDAPGEDLPGDLVQLMIDTNGVKADVAVLKTQDEMIGSILDVLA